MPALYALAFRRLLPERFAVVGAARSEESDDEFRERMKEAVQQHARDEFRQDVWDELAARHALLRRSTSRTTPARTSSTRLLREVDDERGTHGNRVFYFAVPPSAIGRSSSEIAERAPREGLDAADHREAVRPRPRVGARR